jgi:hypothetical protein
MRRSRQTLQKEWLQELRVFGSDRSCRQRRQVYYSLACDKFIDN